MKFTPHPYQQYCIDRIVSDRALGLFLDMGLGKTVITLTAVQELIYNRLQVCRCLIIAPKKVAEATWDTEAAKWDLHDSGQHTEADPCSMQSGRCLHHESGECRLAGGLFQKRMAV